MVRISKSATLVAVSNPGGGIGRHLALTRRCLDGLEVVELPESMGLSAKVREVRAQLGRSGAATIVTHGVAAGLAARHRGRSTRAVRHVEFWHSDPFFLTPRRRLPFRAIARSGVAPDIQVFVTDWLVPVYRDSRVKEFRVLPNAVPIPDAVAPRSAGGRRIVFMGRLSPEKGYEDLVAAWPADAAGQGWHLDVFGEGSGIGRITDGITVRGHTDDPMRELADADVAIIPSWTEASPYVALEAMSVATPLIATRTGDLPMLLRSGCGWSAEPRDVPGLSAAILSALSATAEERRDAGQRGLAWLQANRTFASWQAHVQALYLG